MRYPAQARRAVASAAVVAAVRAAAATTPARGASPADEAEALIRQGIELRHRKQDAKALPLFEQAHALARSPRTAAQLGLVKMALGYWVDAERLLDEALAAPDHPWIANNVRVLEQTRANARKNIGEVAVVGGPAGAELLVNGIPVGRLPLAQPIRLDRGQVELQLRAAGYAPLSRSLRIAGGARERLSMTLERVPGGPGVETAPPPAAATAPPVTRPPGDSATTVAGPQPLSADGGDAAPAAPAATAGTDGAAATGGIAGTPPTPADSETGGGGSRLLRPMAWTAAVGAAAGLTLGVVETIVATNRIDEFNHHTAPSPTADDPDRRVLDCATAQLSDTCRSIRNAHDRARVLAIVGYVAGGALAATSAVLFVLSSRRSPGVDTARAAVACAPELPGPGLACRFSF